ncbi:replication initiator [Pseudonocardia hydrocarbonoxydans]|uniref:Replication initiation protein n=1 Tax=Pseudonocardia hydrocarbonoxydans TaxID=76726 RepID=A0A4Y3WNQ6_9PSEU|nr:replication initiator [Pseudonocardia hydrocarbonoxydans]GEC20537.1 replication initiation protein [Pseudonocardia hydrocarbonoxydans]
MTTTQTPTDAQISHRLRSADFTTWRAQVQATGGCAAPIHLRGGSAVLDRDGAVLLERSGDILAPCGNRRESVCPACSDRYAADAFHLLRAGLAGDDTKGVPATVTDRPRAFVTLTAPTFGPVHTRRVSPRGLVIPCPCGEHHHADDPRPGTALDPDTYDYTGAVLWQAHAGQLWDRFARTLRRRLAALLGVPVREFRDHARLSYAKVAEYQRRGLVHFHAVIRIDGPEGAADPCPPGLDDHALRDAVLHAAASASVTTTRPDGTTLTLHWGGQVDVRPVTPSAAREIEDPDTGAITDAALAGYIAKYATKGTGATDGADRPIRDELHIPLLDVSTHHRAMIATAWDLGALPAYEGLNLRRWAHMLGFRGHFLTKSQRYSTTFRAMRADRRLWRLREDLAALDTDPNGHLVDLDTVVVVNDWQPVRFGHRDEGERELAAAIAERNRQHRINTRRRTS